MKARLPWVVAFAALTRVADACPLCATDTGKEVRRRVLENVPENVALTVAPLPVILAVIAVVLWSLPDPKKGRLSAEEGP